MNRACIAIGVTDYRRAELPDLAFAANDAVRFANALITHCAFQPDSIRLFAGESEIIPTIQRNTPDRSDILSALQKCSNLELDFLVLFFAGHGAEISEVPYLLTNDTRMNVIDNTAIKVGEIDQILRQAKAQCVLKLFDACRAPLGATARDSVLKPMTRGFQDALFRHVKGHATFSACSANENAYEHQDLKHGIFSNHVCKVVEGAGLAGTGLTLEGLIDGVKRGVAIECQQRSIRQTPHYIADVSGSISLVAEHKTEPLPLAKPDERPDPMKEAARRVGELVSAQPAALRGLADTSQAHLSALWELVMNAADAECEKLRGAGYSMEKKTGSAPDIYRNMWNQISRVAQEKQTQSTLVMDSLPAVVFQLAPANSALPMLTIGVCALRFKHFFWLGFRTDGAIPSAAVDPSVLTGNPIFDYSTLLVSALNDGTTIQSAVARLFARLAEKLPQWAEVCLAGVNRALLVEQEEGRLVH